MILLITSILIAIIVLVCLVLIRFLGDDTGGHTAGLCAGFMWIIILILGAFFSCVVALGGFFFWLLTK